MYFRTIRSNLSLDVQVNRIMCYYFTLTFATKYSFVTNLYINMQYTKVYFFNGKSNESAIIKKKQAPILYVHAQYNHNSRPFAGYLLWHGKGKIISGYGHKDTYTSGEIFTVHLLF